MPNPFGCYVLAVGSAVESKFPYRDRVQEENRLLRNLAGASLEDTRSYPLLYLRTRDRVHCKVLGVPSMLDDLIDPSSKGTRC